MRPRSVGTFLISRPGDLGEAGRPVEDALDVVARQVARPRAGGGSCVLLLGHGDLDRVHPVQLAQRDVDPLVAGGRAGSCPRSRGGWAARGGRGRPAPPAAPGSGARSRTARRWPRAPCGRCRARRPPAPRWCRRAGSRCARSAPPAGSPGRGCPRRRGRRRCPRRRAGRGSPTSSAIRSRRRTASRAPRRVDADDRDPLAAGLLDDLVRDADQDPPHVLAVEHFFLAHCTSFLASRDRVKGTALKLAATQDARRHGATGLAALGQRQLDRVEVVAGPRWPRTLRGPRRARSRTG